MGKHAANLPGYEDAESAARDISKLSYRSVRDIVGRLADELKGQAESDLERGRVKLHREIMGAAEKLYEVRDSLDRAWKICEPHTEEI